MDLGARIVFFTHQIGLCKACCGVAKFVMYLALDIADLVFVQLNGICRSCVGRLEVGRQLTHGDADARDRQARAVLVNRRYSGNRVADVAHFSACQGKLVLRDGDDAVRHVACVSRNHRAHTRRFQRLRNINFKKFGVRIGAA